jgi:hypothetical protein
VEDTATTRIIQVLEARLAVSLVALTEAELTRLGEWFPHLRTVFAELGAEMAPKAIAFSAVKPRPSRGGTGL